MIAVMRLATLVVGVGLVFSAALAVGATQHTGQESERLAKAVFRMSVAVRVAERQDKCMAAFAEAMFCTCLNADLPLEFDFLRYVALVSARREQLAADEKALQTTAVASRSRCASAMQQQQLQRPTERPR
jgi:hypothetical protein